MLKAAHAGNWEAVQSAVQAIATPPAVAAAQRQRARTLNEQGLQAWRNGQSSDAISNMSDAALVDPNSAEIRSNLGYFQMRAMQWQDAERNVAASLELGPTRAAAWANLSEIMAEKENATAARAALRLAIYFSSNRQRTVATLANPDQNFTSSKFRDIVMGLLPEVATIPEKP